MVGVLEMIRSFITWRLNFYRFGWWRRLNGIPEPRPISDWDREMLNKSLDVLAGMMKATLETDFAVDWNPLSDQPITIRRPARLKPPHKDRYL